MSEFISKSTFLTPSLLSDSAWLQHVPFAFWIVEKLKPKIVVELGVHTGVSYFALCESVKYNELDCLCYGVDIWQGDEHAGFYGDETYNRVVAHNNEHYAGFSYLLRTDFENALDAFQDGSIDLLHIDGYHTYEAVQKDFKTWSPKLSAKAVVLFHDINVRERNFGVYKLWAEFKTAFPNFEFNFGYGLGVLGVGNKIPEAVTALFSLGDTALHSEINYIYEKLGLNIVSKHKMQYVISEINNLRNQLQQSNQEAAEIHTMVDQNKQQILLLEAEQVTLTSSLTALQKQKEALDINTLILQAKLDQEINQKNNILSNSEETQNELQIRLVELRQMLLVKEKLLHNQAEEYAKELQKLQYSNKDLTTLHENDQQEFIEKNVIIFQLQNEIKEVYKSLNTHSDAFKKELENKEARIQSAFLEMEQLNLELNRVKENEDATKATLQSTLRNLSIKEAEIGKLTLNIEAAYEACKILQTQKDDIINGNLQIVLLKDKNLQEKEDKILGLNTLLEIKNALTEEQFHQIEKIKAKVDEQLNQLQQQNIVLQEKEDQLQILNEDLTVALSDYDDAVKTITLYKDTYVFRSLIGIAKEKMHAGINGKRTKAINNLLSKKYIQKKYVLSFLLEYIKENGVRNSLWTYLKTLRKNGFDVIANPRKQVLSVMNKNAILGNTSLVLGGYDKINYEDLKNEIARFSYLPKMSIVLTTYNTKSGLLIKAIESVKEQIYSNWELCIVDDASTQTNVAETLKKYGDADRIIIKYLDINLGISGALNEAIKLVTGDFIALLDHDDVITPDALFWFVKELNINRNIDILYSDECKVDEEGNLSDYFFKPDWSPELMLNMMYVGHLTAYRKCFLLQETNLFRKEYDFSQDYDLMLRATEKTTNIRHIKKVLYHWRITEGSASQGDKPYARSSNLAALKDAMQRRKILASIIELPSANRVKLIIDPKPKVSIIIPTDSFKNLKEALDKIYAFTNYPNFEIIVVVNSELLTKMDKHFQKNNLLFVPYDKAYNFSDKCNCGAQHANGDIFIFFNDDVRPVKSDWMENTFEYLFIPGVGGVSPKLVYENDTIQYAGMTVGVRNLIGTVLHAYPEDALVYHNYPQLIRNITVLSGACLAIQKNVFNEVGGFDAINTPSAHSDMDLSFKLIEKGFRNVYTPYATLVHIGHLSLKEFEKNEQQKIDKADIFMLKKWLHYLVEDPYFTGPMKHLLYHDSPEQFNIYGKATSHGNIYKADILVITHDLTLSGAPINLYDLCKLLKSNGYFVVVASPKEGPLKELYLQENMPVIIDALLLKEHDTVKRFAKNFDSLICNTIVTWPIVKQMQDIMQVTWWLQEAKIIEAFAQNKDCANTLETANTIVGLSDYALSYIKKFNSKAIKIYNTCIDNYTPGENAKAIITDKSKIVISLVGAVEKRKGQDIFIEALSYLSIDLQEKLEVRLIGRCQDPIFIKKLKRPTRLKCFIRFMGEVTHDECRKLIQETDVLINASRDEPFSVALVEGFCAAKVCLVSEQTGIAELIEDGTNGFVFKHQNVADLAKKLTYVLANRDKLKDIGLAARKTYERFLSMAEFEKKMLQLLSIKKQNAEYKTNIA